MICARRDASYADTPPLLDTVAYHCQQASEKALKTYLALHEIPFRKTHLLVPLLVECTALDPGFEGLAKAAEFLTPFATAFSLSRRWTRS